MKYSPFFILLLALFVVIQPKMGFAQDKPSSNPRKVINRVEPIYPRIARVMKLSGVVKLDALIRPDGSVKSSEAKGGNPLLVQSAQIAIQGWRWEKIDHETTEHVEFLFSPVN